MYYNKKGGKMNQKIVNRLLELSEKAYNMDEIPVAAIVVKNNEIIGEGINDRMNKNSVIGHAEINAIVMASKNIGDWRLNDCEMYVSLEPCMMCTGAIVESRIKRVYYLCHRTNVCFKNFDYIDISKINDADNCKKYMRLLQLFFENKRNKL